MGSTGCLGVARIHAGRIEGEDGALAHFEKARELNPNYKPDTVLYQMGRAYEQIGKYREAFEQYQEALRHNPYSSFTLEALLKMDQSLKESGEEGCLSEETREVYRERLQRLK